MYKKLIPVFTLLLIINFVLAAQSLPRSTPESQDVSSKAIYKFVDAADRSKHEFHSFMIIRHGKVIAEGWWNPYKPEVKHTMYSVSKSFTSTAIGFAVSEGKLTVNDKVISFFPNDLPDTISSNLQELRVKDLLSMSAGQDPDPTSSIRNWNTNWVKSFLLTPIKNKPGTKFLYNSVATFILSAIIQKVTGEKLADYLKPRLFDPLEITEVDWEINPMQINTGGWGLRVKTEDLAKFGLLYLQKGKWNGKQILPKEWVEEATTSKILQSPEISQDKREQSDWLQGYGYKFWRCRYGAFRGDGAFGQYIIMMPEQDAVVAITAESFDLQDELNLVWKYLLPAFSNSSLNEDATNNLLLTKRISTLALPLQEPKSSRMNEDKINHRIFRFGKNELQLENISLDFSDSKCKLTLNSSSESFDIYFRLGDWELGETMRRGPNLIGNAKFSFVGLPPSKIAGSYSWINETTLELVLRYIESPHSERFTFRFENNNNLTLEIKNSINPKPFVLQSAN